ncbi:MAG: hypothetical protein EBR10_08760 [Planctomycetes bacterium]|nr:hypothetical protein [Planctomycetota bacterium]
MKRPAPTVCCALALVVTALSSRALFAQQSAPPIIPKGANLDIDPTEQIDMSGWWSNGAVVLSVKRDGSFLMWDQPNRYREPSARGRWHRQNYRTFWIEPYFDPKTPGNAPPRTRCALRRTNGVLLVDVGAASGLAHSTTPPLAPEDAHVGRWNGPGGTLDLRADGSFSLTAAPLPNSSAPPSVQGGRWTFDGKLIQLFRGEERDAPLRCVPVQRPGAVSSDGSMTNEIVALATPIGELRRLPTNGKDAVK